MRNILVATLALAPVLVHAQTLSPVRSGASAPVLESKLVSPGAVNGAAAASLVKTPVLVKPRLIKSFAVLEDPNLQDASARARERCVTVSMSVTEQGVPTDLKIVESDDPMINRNVLESVAQYRFAPASLHEKPIEVPLVLKLHVVPESR